MVATATIPFFTRMLSTMSQIAKDQSNRRDAGQISRVALELREVATSDVVVLRVPLYDTKTLELVDYSVSNQVPDGESFSIPLQKSFESWGLDDPLGTWGYSTVQDHRCLAVDFYSTEEKAFIEWIKEKAWFPVVFNETSPENRMLLVVLLRGEERPYTREQVANAWVFTLLSLLGRSTEITQEARGFLNAIEKLGLIDPFEGSARAYELILESLEELKWNSIKIFEVMQPNYKNVSLANLRCICGSRGKDAGENKSDSIPFEIDRQLLFQNARRTCGLDGRVAFDLLAQADEQLKAVLRDAGELAVAGSSDFSLYTYSIRSLDETIFIGIGSSEELITPEQLLYTTAVLEHASRILDSVGRVQPSVDRGYDFLDESEKAAIKHEWSKHESFLNQKELEIFQSESTCGTVR